jgi:hypothetical protein
MWLPDNRGSDHQIAKAQAGSLLSFGLGSGVVPVPGSQRPTKPDLSHCQPNDGQTEHDGPDSEDAASEGVCFHGPNLALHAPRVLIERNHSTIDGSDERQKGAIYGAAVRSHRIPALGPRRRAGRRVRIPARSLRRWLLEGKRRSFWCLFGRILLLIASAC